MSHDLSEFIPKDTQESFDHRMELWKAKARMDYLTSEELIGKWKSVKMMLSDLKREEELLRAAMTMRYRDQLLEPSSHNLSIEKIIRKGSVLYRMIPELQGVDLEKYRDDDIEYYKISEIKEKEDDN